MQSSLINLPHWIYKSRRFGLQPWSKTFDWIDTYFQSKIKYILTQPLVPIESQGVQYFKNG